MSHYNTWVDKGLYRKFSNQITGKELLTMNLSIQGDPRFDELDYVINDFSQVTEADFSDIDIKRISATDNAASLSNPELKIALIITFEPLLQLANLYCSLMKDSSYTCKILTSKEEAEHWIFKN